MGLSGISAAQRKELQKKALNDKLVNDLRSENRSDWRIIHVLSAKFLQPCYFVLRG